MSCNGRCLQPLSANRCAVEESRILSHPDCLNIAIGEICEHQGKCRVCSRKFQISNCQGGRNIFIRVFAEQCRTSATDPSSSSVKHQSLPASSHKSFLSKSLVSDEYYLNSTQTDASENNIREFTELLTSREVDFLGAWWTGNLTSNGITICQEQEHFLLDIFYIEVTRNLTILQKQQMDNHSLPSKGQGQISSSASVIRFTIR